MATASSDPLPERRAELQDPLNQYLYHPLARRLARLLLPTGISPNALSVAGCLLVWAAAWFYANVAWPTGALVGFALHLLWHVFDGADGDLARMSGKASATGELVDGVCDYSAHTMLYFVLAAILDDQLGGWAWALAAVAGASHIAQTNHAETQRRAYLWWAYGIPWLKHARERGDEVFREQNWFSRTFSWMARDYLKLAYWMAPNSARLDALVEETAGDPQRLARIHDTVRQSWRANLVFEKIVGPNPRTIMLGLSMLAGSPLWYFLGEAVLLNAILVASVMHHNRVGRRLVAQLG
jgi:hypothetical protein